MTQELVSIPIKNITYELLDREGSDLKDIKSLVSSIKNIGLIQPIVVYRNEETEGNYIIVDGRRRFEACKKAKKASVECLLRDAPEEEGEAEHLSLVSNMERAEPNPIKRAALFASMLEDKVYATQAKLAEDYGVSQSWMSKQLALLETDEEVQEAIEEGEVSPETARKAVRKKKKEARSSASSTSGKKRAKKTSKSDALAAKAVYKRLPPEATTPAEEDGDRDESLVIAVGKEDIKFSINVPHKAVRGKIGIDGYIAEEIIKIGSGELRKAINAVVRREFS